VLDAGVRRSNVHFRSHDAYVSASNPNDSGSVDYTATLPVLGVMFKPTPWLHLYANAAKGFETPTLNELAYRPSGATGLNLALRPAHSRSFEAGAKADLGAAGKLNLAVFDSDTRDEIVTQTNVGGRSTYQNGGRTRRTGVEIAWSLELAKTLQLATAFSTLDAHYRDGFATCASTPCAAPTVQVPAGNRMPGTARANAWAELAWHPVTGWQGGIDLRAVSKVMVNDTNTDAAAACAVTGASLKYAATAGRWRFSGFARVDNVFDRRYAGSVIVNEGNRRYFEPAPGRTWLAGGSAAYEF
jgi:iron complex outermembrane receptor protein